MVGGLEHVLFFHILGIRTPTDELIFFRGIGIPPTRFYWEKWWLNEFFMGYSMRFIMG